MLIVVAEDTGSARTFWLNVLDNTIGNNNYIVSDRYIKTNGEVVDEITGGKNTLEPKINYIFDNENLNKDDTLFIIFDNIGKDFSIEETSYDFIDRIYNYCNENNMNLITTSYYCFEEIYLSYTDVLNRYKSLNKEDNDVIKALNYIYRCINSNIDYFSDMDNIIIKNAIKKLYKKPINRKELTREQFAAKLLGFITNHFPYKFHITKNSEGFECYLISCDTIKEQFVQTNIQRNKDNNKEINIDAIKNSIQRICDNSCTYCCKNKEVITKIDNVFNNSILKNAKYTYTDFKNLK